MAYINVNDSKSASLKELSKPVQLILFISSILIVGFGQPAWNWVLSMIAAAVGVTLILRVLLCHESKKERFWIGTFWFMGVEMIQLSWLTGHPFLYIYGILALFGFMLGIQFGIFSLFVTPNLSFKKILGLAGFWTILEWSRLFFLSGYTWNPMGLSLSANLYSLQTASLWGVYGLTFWVMLTNLLALRAWVYPMQKRVLTAFAVMLLFPYVFGYVHLQIHRPAMEEHQLLEEEPYRVVLVQTVFPIEESLDLGSGKNMVLFVLDEWRQILNIVAHQKGKAIDLMALPEFVVPFGTWNAVYPYDKVRASFEEILGKDTLADLPPLAPPFAMLRENSKGERAWFVSNAFFLQALANIFDSDVLAGLEDVDHSHTGNHDYYSAAVHFKPAKATEEMLADGYVNFPTKRYEKRVLVPMGEYIPFTFLQDLAKEYGVFGSFTCGSGAKVFEDHKVPFGVSICYEETFGDLMRECRLMGAKLLVNVTSDAWFPNSRLPLQHFYHSRLRTVESGVPLVRACNTGVTSGIDSLGQVVAVLGETKEEQEWTSDSIRFELPTYTYQTLYSRVGDSLVIGLSLLFALFFLRFR